MNRGLPRGESLLCGPALTSEELSRHSGGRFSRASASDSSALWLIPCSFLYCAPFSRSGPGLD